MATPGGPSCSSLLSLNRGVFRLAMSLACSGGITLLNGRLRASCMMLLKPNLNELEVGQPGHDSESDAVRRLTAEIRSGA
jgi:hypothetical protein